MGNITSNKMTDINPEPVEVDNGAELKDQVRYLFVGKQAELGVPHSRPKWSGPNQIVS